jgi:hypothetical protein
MKLNRIITLCAVAATLTISATSLLAQDNGGNQGGQGNNQGGGRRSRGNGGQNMDPEQFRQQMQDRMLDFYADELGFTNDTEWDAVKPLVKKVMDSQMESMGSRFGGMGRMMMRNRGGDQGGPGGNRRGGFGAMMQQIPEAEALQKAIDDNAPSAQIKDLLAKYKAVQKAKQAKLEAAQTDLRKVLSTKQEAQATLLGLLS